MFVRPLCPRQFCDDLPLKARNGGRGGIRTHGGLPHARFRVECLKPDSATLPPAKKERRTLNVQHPTSNANAIREDERDADNPRRFVSDRRLVAGESLCCLSPISWQTGLVCLTTKKCYNFRLAKRAERTASCVSTRTATLLLVVDRYSQVLGAAVHEYPNLFRT